jgi:lantibiotic modifying enzyme
MIMQKKIEEIINILTSTIISETGLLSGIAGQILTCSELFLQQKVSQDWLDKLHLVLEERLARDYFLFTYSTGIAGIGLLYEYLSQRKVIDYDTNTLLEEFDTTLEKALKKFMLELNYDLLHGGVGVTLYFAKRTAKKKELVSVLNQFLTDLETISVQQADGALKWSSHFGVHASQQGYNIALSHGISGIVATLPKIYTIEGVDKEKTEMLLRGAIQYVLAQEIDKDKYGSCFPNVALESAPITKSRMAWCYGDLGIASALYQAGKVLQDNNLVNKSLEIFLFAAEKRRNLEDNMVKDAGLCHGTAGIGHIFYRMWRNTKIPQFKNAADYWFEQTMKMAKFEDGIAGFKALEAQGEQPVWVNRTRFLEGVCGIGLAMFTYYYDIEPTWDECLLLS